MKRVLVLVLALFLVAGFASAQSKGLEPLMAPGDLAVQGGIGYGLFYGALDFSAGAELMLGKFMLGDTLPLTYGAAAKANIYSYDSSVVWGSDTWKYTWIGAGGFGTVHLGLKDINLPENMGFLRNVDTYIGLGLGVFSYSYPDWDLNTLEYKQSTKIKIGLRSTAGVNYFITPKIAIVTEGGYYGGWGGGLFGVLVKL